MTFVHSPELEQLFKLYTADPDSIGSHLTHAAESASAAGELVVTTGTDVAVFPGGGRSPAVESFRLSTRGFVELAAISHLGPAVAALVRMRELDPARLALAGRCAAADRSAARGARGQHRAALARPDRGRSLGGPRSQDHRPRRLCLRDHVELSAIRAGGRIRV